MTVHNPPLYVDGGTYDDELLRTEYRAVWSKAGVLDPAHLVVSQTTVASMQLKVSEGFVVVDGTEATFQGRYLCENRGDQLVTIDPSDLTNPRIDLVVARVNSTTGLWALEVRKGTAAPVPAEPSVLANSFVLARVDVDAGAGAISSTGSGTDGTYTDRRYQSGKGLACLRGAPIITVSGQRPTTGLVEGQRLVETDTNRAFLWNGSAWIAEAAYLGPISQFFTGSVSNGTQTGAFANIIQQNGVLVAPFPLTMVVTVSGDFGANAAANVVHIDVTDEAGTPIIQGGVIAVSYIEIINEHASVRKSYSVVGRKDYAAGATCGFRFRYRVDTSNIFIGAHARVDFLPKLS